MPRVTQLTDQAADAKAADLFAAIKAKIGMVPNLYRVAANRPAVLGALLGVTEAVTKGAFDDRTREAIALTVAGANGCDYCASAHSAIAAGLKVDAAEIDRNLSGHAADPRTQAVLRLAAAIVETRGRVSDSDLAAARSAALTDADIVETVSHVVVNLFTNYLNHIAETDIDFPARRARAA